MTTLCKIKIRRYQERSITRLWSLPITPIFYSLVPIMPTLHEKLLGEGTAALNLKAKL
jgi:hypothetical protein